MERLLVVGNGMAGVGCVEQILKHTPRFEITILGDETHVNYNRILLSSLLAGDKTEDEIVLNDIEWYRRHDIRLRLGARAVAIDADRRTVMCADGCALPYDQLILATGSSASIPPLRGLSAPTRLPGREGRYLRNAQYSTALRDGVFVFRTLEDSRALLGRARPGVRAAVIGGGLLGLEAARGLQARGCEVTVVHLPDRLMERQLDLPGSRLLTAQMEALGIRVLLGRTTTAILGAVEVEGLAFADGATLAADLVVIAAGIRPNIELARNAGLECNRGVIVNDFLETSRPGIAAVGECVEHRGFCYGLVAPLVEQGKVLAAALAGIRGSGFSPVAPATKLKVMGVEVYSAGAWDETLRPELEAIRFEDASLGIYKKLVLDQGRLAGFILVGDTSESARYLSWFKAEKDFAGERRHLFFPPPEVDAGAALAGMPASETVCGCRGVTKGEIIGAVHEQGVATLAQLQECTGAASGCGNCAGVCQRLLKMVIPEFEEAVRSQLCACVPFPEEELREILRGQRLRSVQAVLEIYGNGIGCEACKPALAYMLDMIWCGGHDEDRSARFINDRVHANIQKDGTFSVVPRMRGGVTTPAELRRIADVAEKYQVRMVKVTGSQRLDLLGVSKADLPSIWAELGMASGQAYTKGVRMVKTCVGSEFCRFGVQDSTAAGIELERRLENLYAPHKVKMAAVGCPRNCAEATVKDIGLVGQEGSWQVVVGGAAGKRVRAADLLITVETTEAALDAATLFFQYYRERANYLERSYDFVERVGMEKIRQETVYAPEPQQQALRDRLRRSKARARDAWLDRDLPPAASPFVQIQPLEEVVR